MPTNEKYLVGSFENNIDPQILNWEKNTYGGFMENHKGSQDDTTKDPIIERQHLAFMLYWICTHFIRTKSIQVPTSFYNLV